MASILAIKRLEMGDWTAGSRTVNLMKMKKSSNIVWKAFSQLKDNKRNAKKQ